jgi:hypothetical protein
MVLLLQIEIVVLGMDLLQQVMKRLGLIEMDKLTQAAAVVVRQKMLIALLIKVQLVVQVVLV